MISSPHYSKVTVWRVTFCRVLTMASLRLWGAFVSKQDADCRTGLARQAAVILLRVVPTIVFLLLSPQVLGLGVNTHSVPNRLSFAHISPDQVEALGHINAIVADRFGFLWFGGDSGLARFDGYHLRIYLHRQGDPSSLPHNTVTRLLLSEDGGLWLATGAGLSHYRSESDDFITYRPSVEMIAGASNSIRAIAEDGNNGFWLGTADGLVYFDRAAKQFRQEALQTNTADPSLGGAVWDLVVQADGVIWIALQEQGLGRFDPSTKQLSILPLHVNSRNHDDVRSVYIDSRERLWVGTYTGEVAMLAPGSSEFVIFTPAPGQRRDVVWRFGEDKQGRIWAGDGAGLNFLQEEQRLYQRYSHDQLNTTSLGNYAVRAIFTDAVGDLWLGFFPSGIDRLDWLSSVFQNYSHHPLDPNSLTDGGVLAVAEDAQHNLWIGTGFGLSYFDRSKKQFRPYRHQPENANSLLGNTSVSLLLDSQNQLWVGSWSKGLNRMDISSGQIRRYVEERGNAHSLLGLEPWSLIEDQAGDIWVATEQGVSRYNRQSDDFTRFYPLESQLGGSANLYARVIFEDSAGRIWIGADSGLYLLDSKTGQFTHYANNPDNNHSLAADFVRAIFEDSAGNFWIGTHGGGLNLMDRESGRFVMFGLEQGLHDQIVTAITEDHDGFLWLTTHHGVARFDSRDKSFKVFNKIHGLLDNLFSRNAAMTLSSGEIFLGSSKGFSLLEPSALVSNPHPPEVMFTDFQIFNRSVSPKDPNSPLNKSLNHTHEITLNYQQSVFSLEFSALNYRLTENNEYAYRLEGFDDEWHFVGKKRSATYTNLDAGHYLFKVKASNNDGVWSDQAATMAIRILPPPWLTWWAYGIYSLIALVLLLFFVHFQYKRIELYQEKKVNAKLRKLDKIKDSFLANTSHELRTPLNGMIGIAEALIDGYDGPVSAAIRKKLEMIRSSGKRLSSLVNDILDYAKLTEHSLEIRLRPVNVAAVLHEVTYILRPLAESKNLELLCDLTDNTPWVMSDENRLQQILFNLLGNAIKFTDSGRVTVSVSQPGGKVKIMVRDSGMGIREEDIHSVFIAFHQLDLNSEQTINGTGLGLAITKQLVELQGGDIGVTSRWGLGSSFWFTLHQAEQQADIVGVMSAEPAAHYPMPPAVAAAALEESQQMNAQVKTLPMIENPEKYCVLIVDDDPVNRIVLRGMLEQHRYQVIEANNGTEAIKILAGEQRVNLVLLDVMMPRVSGFEVCEAVRKSHCLLELPVIFLTAQKNDEDLLRGFAVGANEFLTKPVSKYELLALVTNHLRSATMNSRLNDALNKAG